MCLFDFSYKKRLKIEKKKHDMLCSVEKKKVRLRICIYNIEFFFRKFQSMESIPNNSFLSSDYNTNQFFV